MPAIKIAQFLAAGCDVTVLLADIHGFLDNLKAPLELVMYRAEFYRYVITEMLKAVGVSTEKLRVVLGSSYQKSPEYVMDVYKMASLISEHDAKKAGAEVVKQTDNAPMSGLLYPILQVLDEQYLDCDAQFGGMDQRKLFTAAKDWLPKLGYRERAHLLNPMVPGLHGGKMSSSDPDSKIDLLDSAETVAKKIKKAHAAPQVVEENGLLAFIEYVLFPAARLRGNGEFLVERERDGLPTLVYTDIEKVREDYKNDVVSHPFASTQPELFSDMWILTAVRTVDTPTHQTRHLARAQRATGAHPGRVPGLQGVARDRGEGLPATAQEGEESQEQGHALPRRRRPRKGRRAAAQGQGAANPPQRGDSQLRSRDAREEVM